MHFQHLRVRALFLVCVFQFFSGLATSQTPSAPAGTLKRQFAILSSEDICFHGTQNYDGPKDEFHRPAQESEGESGPFLLKKWQKFLKTDPAKVVPFLIAQLPNRHKSRIHVCPGGDAICGELAVYCLQHVLRVNWPDLGSRYSKISQTAKDDEEGNAQTYLQRELRSPARCRAMQTAWKKWYEAHGIPPSK